MRPRRGDAMGGVPVYAGAGKVCCWHCNVLHSRRRAGMVVEPPSPAPVPATHGTPNEIWTPLTFRGYALH